MCKNRSDVALGGYLLPPYGPNAAMGGAAHQGHLLTLSSIDTQSAKDDVDLEYESEGGDQENVW